MKLVEKMARAMLPTIGESNMPLAGELALAALWAMREPTEAMTQAMVFPRNAECFTAAIDAAIAEAETP
jgi:hypothetical protein